MAINKKTRERVYLKYNGHCSYCGKAIAYKDMQVDHLKPLGAYNEENRGTDDFENLMPSCRRCNHYKRANTLEAFRKMIEEIPRKLERNYIYKVGVDYGNVVPMPHPVKFYFELSEETCDVHCKFCEPVGKFVGNCSATHETVLFGSPCCLDKRKGGGSEWQ